MKIIKVTTLVISAHACIFGLLFLQPGCQSTPHVAWKNTSDQEDPFVPRMKTQGDMFGHEDQVVAEDVYFDEFNSDFQFDDAGETTVAHSTPSAKSLRMPPTRPTWNMVTEEETATSVVKPLPNTPSPTALTKLDGKRYTVRSGDSLWVIARRNKLSVQELAAANDINKNAVLRVGQELFIPTYVPSAEGAYVTSTEGGTYTIQKGDTLSGIAHKFHVKTKDLRVANNISGDRIVAGKKIIIPGVDAETIKSVPQSTSTATSMVASSEGSYKVKSGDSLSVIARRFGVKVSDLMEWNNISDARKLRAGQKLVVSMSDSASSTSFSSSEGHMVAGDPFADFESSLPDVSTESSDDFDLFDDDSLFDDTGEIPVVSLSNN